MRRLISSFLLFIWLINVMGGLGYFVAQLHYQRRVMHELLSLASRTDLTLLTLTANEYEKARYEHDELMLGGKMFDVAFVERRGELFNVYGLFDDHEDELVSSLHEQSKKQAENSSCQQVIKQFVSLSYLDEHFEFKTLVQPTSIPSYDQRSDALIDLIPTIELPPPRFASLS